MTTLMTTTPLENFGPLQMIKKPRTIDAYEKLEWVGSGSYGSVYKARERITGEICAVKEFKNPAGSVSVDNEIELLASCRHPSIVEFKEVLPSRNPNNYSKMYLVMEYADQDLRSYINSKSNLFREEEVRDIICDVLGAVYYLHKQGIMHRDIKTANLLVTPSGKVKLCDFALTRRFQDGNDDQRGWWELEKPDHYSTRVGTRGYMAPELLRDQRYTSNIDVWSVGCVMAELLRKEPLFPKRCPISEQIDRINYLLYSTKLEELYDVHEDGDDYYCPLRDRFPSPLLSNEGYDLLARMLTINPQRRINSRDAVWHDWFVEF